MRTSKKNDVESIDQATSPTLIPSFQEHVPGDTVLEKVTKTNIF